MLQVLPGVAQNKGQYFHGFPKPHLISKDPTRPVHSSQRKLSDQAVIELKVIRTSKTDLQN